jgi:hypothetical protein
MVSLGEFLRGRAEGVADARRIEAALSSLGERQHVALTQLEATRRGAAIGQFVRNLRGLAVEESTALERRLLHAANAFPPAKQELALRDALSLIALRNTVRYLAVVLGFPWSEGMLVEAALSELGRTLQEAGGATLTIEVDLAASAFAVSVLTPGVTAFTRAQLEDWRRSLPSSVRASVGQGSQSAVVQLQVQAPVAA